MGAGQIARPYAGGEPVLRVVRALDDVALVAPGLHGDHRAEDLVACGRGLPGGVVDDRRLEVEASRERALSREPRAPDNARAFGTGLLDEAMHALEMRLRDERPDVRRLVEGVADPEPRERGGELEELVVDRLVDVEARGGEADLAVLERDPHRRVGDRHVEVGVVADHEGALAAELEQRGRNVLVDPRQDPPRRRNAAREGDFRQVTRGDKRVQRQSLVE